jgi:hypothetical protein
MKNSLYKRCRENQNPPFMFGNFFFFQKSCRLWDNVEKHGRPKQAADYIIILRMRFACWMTKAVQYLLLFHGNNGYANGPQYYVTRTLTIFCYTYIWTSFKVCVTLCWHKAKWCPLDIVKCRYWSHCCIVLCISTAKHCLQSVEPCFIYK